MLEQCGTQQNNQFLLGGLADKCDNSHGINKRLLTTNIV